MVSRKKKCPICQHSNTYSVYPFPASQTFRVHCTSLTFNRMYEVPPVPPHTQLPATTTILFLINRYWGLFLAGKAAGA